MAPLRELHGQQTLAYIDILTRHPARTP